MADNTIRPRPTIKANPPRPPGVTPEKIAAAGKITSLLSKGIDAIPGVLRAIGGEGKEIDTPRGPVKYTQGGLISRLRDTPFALGGQIYNSDKAAAMTPETAVHEKFGHIRGKGAAYDFTSRMLGLASTDPVKEFALKPEEAEFFQPSEIYAYTTQPMSGSYQDMQRYAKAMKDPKFAEYFAKHKNPESDWDFDRMMEFQPKAPVATESIMNNPEMIAFKKRQAELAAGGNK
jgi:hypothetical protein